MMDYEKEIQRALLCLQINRGKSKDKRRPFFMPIKNTKLLIILTTTTNIPYY